MEFWGRKNGTWRRSNFPGANPTNTSYKSGVVKIFNKLKKIWRGAMPLFFIINQTNNAYYVNEHNSTAMFSLKKLTPSRDSNPDLMFLRLMR
jgi:hypothetical protein